MNIINRLNINIISQDVDIIVSIKKDHLTWISTSNDQHHLFAKINKFIDGKIGLHQLISAIMTTPHTTGIIVNIVNIIITVDISNIGSDGQVRTYTLNSQRRLRVELSEPINERTDLHQVTVLSKRYFGQLPTSKEKSSLDVEQRSFTKRP